MELDELIKELDNKLIVTGKEIIDDIMYIYCETKKQKTKCEAGTGYEGGQVTGWRRKRKYT